MLTNLPPTAQLLILIGALWVVPWKGVALWKAARNGQKVWFVALLIIQTLGFLEIVYIFMFSKPKAEATQVTPLKR